PPPKMVVRHPVKSLAAYLGQPGETIVEQLGALMGVASPPVPPIGPPIVEPVSSPIPGNVAPCRPRDDLRAAVP
ncbi:MAG: hypothetical protein WD225_13535, partial [Ilumatobacteraceae bacterium]